jgi:tetratricopeptide (TPR) repeat protein
MRRRWREALITTALLLGWSLAQEVAAWGAVPAPPFQEQSSSGSGTELAPATRSGPSTPPENERPIGRKPSSDNPRVYRAPDCRELWGAVGCAPEPPEPPEPPEQPSSAQSAEEGQGIGNPQTVPENSPPPRSSSQGSSSSRETKIEPGPSGGTGAVDVTEMHPFDPHKAAKNVEVGDFYFKRGNYKAAISRFREALDWKPRDALATFRLAEALEKDGQLEQSRAGYEEYLKILPGGEFAERATQALARLNRQLQAATPPVR